MPEISDNLPILGALLSLAGLCASFVYAASYRLLRELIDVAYLSNVPKKLQYKIQEYYLFSDFILDYIYGGSLSALVLILSTYCTSGKWHTIFRYGWVVLFISIIISWVLRIKELQKENNWEGLRSLRDWSSSVLIIAIVYLEVTFSIITSWSCLNTLNQIIDLMLPKFIALVLWLVLGIIWGPFSAYVDIKRTIKK